jgi:hypothetical protein
MRLIFSLLCISLVLACTNSDTASTQSVNSQLGEAVKQDQNQTNQKEEPSKYSEGANTEKEVSTTGTNANNASKETVFADSTGLIFGKYGCTASKYVNGSYEYTPRGYFTISSNGEYVYYGLDKPSKGSFTVDKEGNLHFTGGYFDKGKAEKIDRPNKFFLVFPTIPDNRWTCGLVNDEK